MKNLLLREDLLIKLYRSCTIIFAPLIDLYLVYRLKKGKEDKIRYKERLGKISLKRPSGKLIWIHCASVGESISVLPLVKLLLAKDSQINILFTTITVTSANLLKERLPNNAFHQFIPMDKDSAVKSFVEHWHPDLALWVESELWPNLLTRISNVCPLLLINGRMSDKSFGKWQKFPKTIQSLLSNFMQIYPQSLIDKERYDKLSGKTNICLGNIKYDSSPLPCDEEKLVFLKENTKNRLIWLCTSTHNGEEKMLASVHASLKEYLPGLLTIIVPRHPNRSAQICKDCEEFSVDIAVRSKNAEITSKTDIYLCDTLGELGLFYRLAPVVFIGGSLVPHGGQNPLEAARLNCTIIFGPYMHNFITIRDEFLEKKAAIQIDSKIMLEEKLADIIQDKKLQESCCKAAKQIVDEKSGIIESYAKAIMSYLK